MLVGVDGRIESVGPEEAVPRLAGAELCHLGEAILMPGLVNAHSHLELTALRGLVPPAPFRDWVYRVRDLKAALDHDDFLASARWGVLEGFAAGITCTADTGSTRAPAKAMAALGVRGIAFHEVFGPDPAQAQIAAAALADEWRELSALDSERLTVGISPHAPYTVSDELARAVAALATANDVPLAVHLAESPEERALVVEGAGPFAEALRERGIAVGPRGASCVAWAEAIGLLELAPLLIHCVQCDREDLHRIALHGATVAHCPWSNRELGHGDADLRSMLEEGIAVGVGTDSVATGGALDLFRAARLAAELAGLAADYTVRLITLEAARAIGVSDAGALEPGAWADLVALDPGSGPESGPELAVVNSTPGAVRRTWVAGEPVYDRDGAEGPAWVGVNAASEREACERAGERARSALDSSLAMKRAKP